jgi:putative solute:sodium symporter small subunit
MSTSVDLLDPVRRAQLMQARSEHWQRARRVTVALLLLWFGATFLTVFYARELATLTVFGWPLSFYLAAQGVALLNLAIVGVYALVLNRLDRRFARQLAQGAP